MGNNRISIELIPFSEKFISIEYISWLNNSSLMQYSEQRHKTHTFQSCKDYFFSIKNSNNLLYAVLNKENKQHVGNINAYIDIENNIADIGIIIGQVGHGYGLLAWKEMIRILFIKKKIRKITAGAMKINEPMIKIFKKSGMQYEYTKENHFMYNKQYVDLVAYSIFLSNW